MAAIRHPNVVNFLGICLMPPCLITGAWECIGAVQHPCTCKDFAGA